MVIKAIELKQKTTIGEQYSSKPHYVGNPGDVLADLDNGEQAIIPNNLYKVLVAKNLAPDLDKQIR
ncbi:MAG: hypothetical protein WAQ98_11150 [Blastocatellia bacterium]|jgi:hypothetical protein